MLMHSRKQNEASANQMGGRMWMEKMHQHRPLHAISRIVTWLLRRGVPASILGNPVFLLTVRGRKSGQPRSFPVDLYEYNGRSFLVATHGEGDWVRNLRAAGEGMVSRGRRRQAFTAVEMTPEAAGPMLKEALASRLALPHRGLVLRRTLRVQPDASVEEFTDAARRCPVFEVKYTNA
jgi:deazaflavin-dependent oxidoreductase (nitroreductase family)